MWVLVVDDDPHVRFAMARVLGRAAARVNTVASLSHGLELLAQGGPQVVLLDWCVLNGMTALEFAQRCGVPVVFHTASPEAVPPGWWVVAKPAPPALIIQALEAAAAGAAPERVDRLNRPG